MKRSHLKIIILICVSILFFTNCEDINNDNEVSAEDSLAAVVLVANAHASLLPAIEDLFAVEPDSAQTILNGLSLSESYGFYAEANVLDWRNQEANFGLGFTSMLILSQNAVLSDIFGSKVKVYAPFDEEGAASNSVGYAFGLPLSVSRVSGMIASFFETPLSFARLQFESLESFNEFQIQVNDDLIPMVEAGIAVLDSIDDNQDFVFSLGGGMQLDIVDVIAMESSLYALQGFFRGLTAYNYELDTEDPSAIITGLSPGSAFGTLNTNGAILDAHISAVTSIELAEQVLSLIEAESTEMNHLLVQFTQSESAQIGVSLGTLSSALSGPTSVEYVYADERGDYTLGGTALIDISQYYLNPVTDSKTLLPPYTMSTAIAYNYNQVTLYEQISFEETQVLLAGLDNTPISINIEYSESNSDTTATVRLGFLTFNLMTANQGDLPAAIWELWAEFQLTLGEYSDELHNFPEISFQWSGVITTGTSLVIDGNIAIDYLERTSSYTAPDILWAATSYGDWLSGWSNPTANGMFPDFLAEDLALLLGVTWE